jgi:hypothetical protein
VAKYILKSEDLRSGSFPDISKELDIIRKLFTRGTSRALFPLELIIAQNTIEEIERKYLIAEAIYHY